ncbi:MAG: TrkA family potassium uptake protein [Oscillospiraceae bacterium]|nr:TrkA family potassium uptake protein [Oscillospiraceae bacterium]
MNILIIGSGMVGSALAATLDERGHDVSVIDRSESDFDSLPAKFGGFTTTGVAIDQDVLKRAGIQTCDVLFAVTAQDDINIMVSELARQMYNVPRIFARITDIRKGEVFEQLGVNIICPTKLTVSAACAALEEDGGAQVNFENHTVRFSTLDLPEELLMAMPDDIEYEEDEVLFGVLRSGSGLILYHGQPLNFIEGDKLIFAKKS